MECRLDKYNFNVYLNETHHTSLFLFFVFLIYVIFFFFLIKKKLFLVIINPDHVLIVCLSIGW